jgi:sulfur carrier protein
MEITLNGAPRELPAPMTVAGLVGTLGVRADGRGVAVAVDGEVLTRAAWAETALREGARVEVVVAVQGG